MGSPVLFRARHVHLPPPAELLGLLWGDTVLRGQVIAESRGEGDALYVVVQIDAMATPVVVPVARLLRE